MNAIRKSLYAIVATVVLAGAASATRAAEESAAAQANNAFGLDLYSRLKEQPGNLFFSPYSISTALGMTYAGAKGETAAQMEKVLHFTQGQAVHSSLAVLQKQLNAAGQGKGMELTIANGLWAQQGHAFLPAFLDLARDRYQAKIAQADFKEDAEGVRSVINKWVEQQTRARIQNLLPAGSLDNLTRMVLANAIYFKGVWAKQFRTSQTTRQTFFASPNTLMQAPLMRQVNDVKYMQNDLLQAVEIPYAGGDLAMVVLLPLEKDGLAKVERGLAANSLATILSQMRSQEVEIFLPRFKLSSGLPLGAALIDLGMPSAFDRTSDFSGMDGTKDLYISQVFHKAWGQVNEEGTEAAAATGVVVATRAAAVAPKPKVFRADHPFVFMIRDTRSGALLFLGRLSEPRE